MARGKGGKGFIYASLPLDMTQTFHELEEERPGTITALFLAYMDYAQDHAQDAAAPDEVPDAPQGFSLAARQTWRRLIQVYNGKLESYLAQVEGGKKAQPGPGRPKGSRNKARAEDDDLPGYAPTEARIRALVRAQWSERWDEDDYEQHGMNARIARSIQDKIAEKLSQAIALREPFAGVIPITGEDVLVKIMQLLLEDGPCCQGRAEEFVARYADEIDPDPERILEDAVPIFTEYMQPGYDNDLQRGNWFKDSWNCYVIDEWGDPPHLETEASLFHDWASLKRFIEGRKDYEAYRKALFDDLQDQAVVDRYFEWVKATGWKIVELPKLYTEYLARTADAQSSAPQDDEDDW